MSKSKSAETGRTPARVPHGSPTEGWTIWEAFQKTSDPNKIKRWNELVAQGFPRITLTPNAPQPDLHLHEEALALEQELETAFREKLNNSELVAFGLDENSALDRGRQEIHLDRWSTLKPSVPFSRILKEDHNVTLHGFGTTIFSIRIFTPNSSTGVSKVQQKAARAKEAKHWLERQMQFTDPKQTTKRELCWAMQTKFKISQNLAETMWASTVSMPKFAAWSRPGRKSVKKTT